MKRKSRGQTLVEFALVFPFIILILFATIDFGYWIFGWAEVQFAARRGAEQASKSQPRDRKTEAAYQTTTDDPCLNKVFSEAARSGAFSNATKITPANIFIGFYANGADSGGVTDATFKKPGRIVQVRVQKSLVPLTPFGQSALSILGDGDGQFSFTALSRRTIVSNGPGYQSIETDSAGRVYDLNKCVFK
ncbi:MAG: pilus assembly protein [Herpetosiphon sp.]|nr:pilus assembly protein [Herpetosiphon sp.]